MPRYVYECPKCKESFDDIRGINASTEIDCPKCSFKCDDSNYDWSKFKVTIMNTKVTSAEYNPGLGTVVKNEYHKKELMKQKDVVEVGNDFGSGAKQQDFHEKRKKEELENNWKDPSSFTLE